MKPPQWLADLEIRLCSAVSVVSLLLFGVALHLFFYPLFVYYATTTELGDCQVVSTRKSFKIPCDFNSCANSCTGEELPCLEYETKANNMTLPLIAGYVSCGISVNCSYFKEFFQPHKIFKCEIFKSKGRLVATPKASTLDPVTYLCLTCVPLFSLTVCALYVGCRHVVERAYPEKEGKKKQPKPPEPKSFYQRKLLELERLKKEREERERIAAYNDTVRVEELNTVTALIFKPSTSWMEPQWDLTESESTTAINS